MTLFVGQNIHSVSWTVPTYKCAHLGLGYLVPFPDLHITSCYCMLSWGCQSSGIRHFDPKPNKFDPCEEVVLQVTDKKSFI